MKWGKGIFFLKIKFGLVNLELKFVFGLINIGNVYFFVIYFLIFMRVSVILLIFN